ncbi:MAG: 1,4-dihydroxy-2-naphthoate polyprenyltransferase [Proteobacteria bacterium]|nr:1,4-dihydroxy-2-naphthoate polyprenyltransferase [Pseudomonadota bacterium]
MSAENKNTTSLQVWILAIRPRTLPAALAPVAVGTALAFADLHFRLFPALAALAVSLLLQIGVNLANDYFDCVKGIDTEERLGPVRVTQSGLIPPQTVRTGMHSVLALAAAFGAYLVFVGGWPILLLGIAAVLAALAYSGGPFPLASNGLGDLFVFIFFGLVAVGGTYYVQALQLPLRVAIIAVPVGLLTTAILVVNNLRDIETDRKAGKVTLAVILGKRGSRVEYSLLLAVAYAIPVVLWSLETLSGWILLHLISLPLAFPTIRTVWRHRGPVLNRALVGTARLSLVFSLLLSVGLILAST